MIDLESCTNTRLRVYKKICNRALSELQEKDGVELFDVWTSKYQGSNRYFNVGEVLVDELKIDVEGSHHNLVVSLEKYIDAIKDILKIRRPFKSGQYSIETERKVG
jgi:hypothetical protein